MKQTRVGVSSIGDLFFAKLESDLLVGQIHSIFSSVINVQIDNDLYTLGTPKIGKGPVNMIISEFSVPFDQYGLLPEQPVHLVGKELHLNHRLKVDFTHGEVWSSTWDCTGYDDCEQHLARTIPRARSFLLREGNLQGVAQLLVDPVPTSLLTEMALPAIRALQHGLVEGSDLFWTGVRELMGVGPGLTPAGDDLLVGFLQMSYWLQRMGLGQLPPYDLMTLNDWIEQHTNLISGTGIRLALAGRPLEVVKSVIDSLAVGTDPQMFLKMLRLIDLGSTSGSDLLTGIILAGEMFLRKNRSHYHL